MRSFINNLLTRLTPHSAGTTSTEMMKAPDVVFHQMLADAANAKIGKYYVDEGDTEIDVGQDIPNDGKLADAVDEDGGKWRVKVEPNEGGYTVTRHRILG